MRSFLLSTLLGCATAVPMPPAQSAASASVATAPPPTPCPAGLEVRPTVTPTDCGQQDCPVDVRIEVVNCGDSDETIVRAEIQTPETEELVAGVALTFEFADPTLSPGESRTHTFQWRYFGEYVVVIHRRSRPEVPIRANLLIHNPGQEKAREAASHESRSLRKR